jgi:hypothetical protein
MLVVTTFAALKHVPINCLYENSEGGRRNVSECVIGLGSERFSIDHVHSFFLRHSSLLRYKLEFHGQSRPGI